MNNPDLSVTIAGVKFKNPVITASGTYGLGLDYSELYPPSLLGGISLKGVTLNPTEGNTGIRLHETAAGLMNSIGMQNKGINHLINKDLPKLINCGTVIIANVSGETEEDYIETVSRLNDTIVDIIELNISCPNVRLGGMAFGMQTKTASRITGKIRRVCRKPLMVKLSPNAEDIAAVAKACVQSGADALSLVNTFKSLAIDIYRRRPIFDNTFAGLSGPAIKPIALAMVWEVCRAADVPVIGLGGISSWEDAVEFLMAGASAVQIGTSNFTNPMTAVEIIAGIEKFMRVNNIPNIDSLKL